MLNKYSILIVDNDKSHRIMLRTLVRSWGYLIFEADDGSSAIEKVYQQLYYRLSHN